MLDPNILTTTVTTFISQYNQKQSDKSALNTATLAVQAAQTAVQTAQTAEQASQQTLVSYVNSVVQGQVAFDPSVFMGCVNDFQSKVQTTTQSVPAVTTAQAQADLLTAAVTKDTTDLNTTAQTIQSSVTTALAD